MNERRKFVLDANVIISALILIYLSYFYGSQDTLILSLSNVNLASKYSWSGYRQSLKPNK